MNESTPPVMTPSETSLPAIELFNTLTRRIDRLEPLRPPEVRLYCCGPTVYNFPHIGNLRTYLFEDLLVRTLRYAGYRVRHVMNITDVGHLASDADEGDDKMVLAMRRENKRSHEIADYYTGVFFEHCAQLNILKPDVVCKATDHIPQMIELIKRLEEQGFAYESGGNVYFDVRRFDRYGELARLDLQALHAGARIEVDERKRSPLDFALWFTRSKFENQELQWDSPWGVGYPGWHIECSAMAMQYLGETLDIHCGGIDHIPVHHTNEIAQSECATGKPFASIWMHGGFLIMDKTKMSKSSGEFLTLDVLKEKGFDPIAFRLLALGGSYRNELSWSWEALEGAANTLKKLRNQVLQWREESATAPDRAAAESTSVDSLRSAFQRAIFYDLGAPNALAVLHQLGSDRSLAAHEKVALAEEFDHVLGLGVARWNSELFEIPRSVTKLAEAREAARAKKDWATADALRKEIAALGFAVEDSAGGFRIKPL